MNFGTVAILGPGLLGGSLALALAERSLMDRLSIYARSPRALEEVRVGGVEAELFTKPSEAVRAANVVILCVPIEAMAGLVLQIRDDLKPDALVTDVGSVKGSVVREIEPLLAGRALWIGSHPMAGSEQTGFAAARADLFQDAPVILTPTLETPANATQRAEQFWQALGARVTKLSPDEHDEVVAQISHVPHLVAAALAARVSEAALPLAAGGFRDTTRVASGPPELWAEILSGNAEAVVKHLDLLLRDLQAVKTALEQLANPAAKSLLLATLKAGQEARAKLPSGPIKRP